MKATLEKINSISQAVAVEVSASAVAKSREKILIQLGKEMKIPGFRAGKVPSHIIAKRLGSDADREIIQQIVRDSYPEAIRAVGARPISDPRIEAGTFESEQSFSYRAIFDIYPEVVVEGFEGLKLERETVEVMAEDVEVELGNLRHRMTQLEPVPDAVIAKGMMALIDFSGTADGKSFKGSTAENFVVDFGSGHLLVNFESQIEGMKAGEHRKISVRYPDDYFNKEVAGKNGEFEVTVKEVRRKIVPELDDDLAKSVGKFKNMDELRTDMKKRIADAKEEEWRRKLHRQVVEQLSQKFPIDVPEVMVSQTLSGMLEELARELEARGQTLEDAKVDAKSFVQQNFDEAKLRTRGLILVDAIARKEGVALEPDEISARIKLMAAQSGQPEAKIRAHFEKNQLMGRLGTDLLVEKTLDFIVGKSKIKYVKPKNKKKSEK